MRVLLDSHTFLWLAREPARLSPAALAVCRNRENTLLLSVVSLWEIQIKAQLNKLPLAAPLAEIFYGQLQVNQLVLLGVEVQHIFFLDHLAAVHRDPFDRLLIAQASVEKVALISQDAIFNQYAMHVIW
jgi:PIN domain nuclease of toxin-antitoxin system